jgi:FdhD protein
MQVPVLVSRSGLTKMGHEVAKQVGITMIGRAVNRRYLLFTGPQRLVRSVAAAQPKARPAARRG